MITKARNSLSSLLALMQSLQTGQIQWGIKDDTHFLVDVSDIFFLLGEGEGELFTVIRALS